MRRVYYAYMLRVVTHRLTIHAGLLGVMLYALASLVHFKRVFQNIGSVEVNALAGKVFHILTHADALTLLVCGVIVMTLLSVPLQTPRRQRMKMA